ncbi:MAG TPA: amino acid adenylation domain-containing protein, partial [Candidatus Deferrimicrobium sp.]|nr:amino acid adenylation domain-containing protein [Candidatus Deferrimicrobium sp.]
MKNERYLDQAVIAANQGIKEKDYWLNRLGGYFARTGFPYEINGGSAGPDSSEKKEMAIIDSEFPGSLLEKLMKLSGGIDLKLHMILVAGLMALLHRYSRSSDITIGSPIIKQDIDTTGAGGTDIEGKFINTILVYRNHIRENMKFKELLIQVRETIIQAAEHQNFPVHVLPVFLNLPEMGNEFPLFDVALMLENIHDKAYLYPVENGYNMLFSFQRGGVGNRIRVNLEYNSHLYREQYAAQILNHYTRLLEEALGDLDVPFAHIDILTEAERKQLLSEFNGRDEEYSCTKTFHQLFADQVERTPHRIVVVGPVGIVGLVRQASLTYRRLNEQSGRLAQLLIEKSVRPDDIVGLKIDRSIEMIVGVMGILKSGGAYMPIDPGYPKERIDYMLKDSAAKILLTAAECVFNFHHSSFIAHHSSHLHLAYVIYTSGSTGKPKGVMVQHNHFVNVAIGWRREYRLLEMEVILLQMANFCFDVFAGDLARVLINGGKMIINPEQAASPHTLYRLISTHGVTLLESTPPYIIPFMNYIYENKLAGGISSLQLLILGSDSCPVRDFKELLSRFGTQMRIVNSYGITEATIDSSYYETAPAEDIPAVDTVPIGKPLPNVKFYIVDPVGMLLPVGVPGELCIGGASVTRGYLNKPELTAERFHRPYSTHKTYICYKTGDLARWLADGNVEFLGRMDYQVKMRGFRIELGEIENKLLEHPDIKEALVVHRTDVNNNDYLCGYFISDKNIDVDGLRNFLGKMLPDYMVPWFYTQLKQFPLSANGKIDRKALPDPDIFEEAPYAAPRNKNERKMIELWADILSVDKERIGIDSRFFDLGGNSLKAIILTTRMHKLFDVKLNMADIFKIQTIRNISELIRKTATDKFIPLEKAEEKEFYPLPPTQKRFYTLHHMEAANTTFNMPLGVKLEGNVDPERVEIAFKQLIRRHESLRTSFAVIGKEPVQRVHREVEFKIELLGTKGQGSVWASFIRPFDLARAPLLRVRLIKEAEETYLLMVDIHHIVSDGTSHHILLNDFRMLYRGEKDRLPELPFQYRDFANWQNYQMSGLMKVHEDFWLKQLAGKIPLLHMPTDYPRPKQRSFEGDIISFSLGKELGRKVQEFIAGRGTTLYILLLTALNILLYRYTGQKDIIIGSPIAGRYHADLENVIGLVLGTIMMRNFPSSEKTFESFLAEVMKNTLQVYEHQAYPFEELMKKVEFVDEPGRDPLTDIALIVQNMGSEEDLKQFLKLSDDLKITPLEPDKGKMSKVDFTISAVPAEDDAVFSLEYCTRLFKPRTMNRFICHFKNILREGLSHPHLLLEEIDIRTDEEKLEFIGAVEKCYPLSHPQKRIYYTERKYPDTSCNILAFTIRYEEELDKKVLEEAIAEVIRGNEGLRLRMVEFPFDREPVQYVHPLETFNLDYIDFGSGGVCYDDWEQENTRKPFDLLHSDLFYFAYLRFSNRESGYYMKIHHLICDGWTTLLLFAEIDKIYGERKAGKPLQENSHPAYLRFAADEKDYLKSPQAAKDKIAWKQMLLPLPEEVDLSAPVKMEKNIKAAVSTLAFPGLLREKLEIYSKERQTSSFKLILAALAIYISRAARIEDIVIGSANHNRVTPEHKQMMGMFASTILIRLDAAGGRSFSDFVNQTGNTINYIIKNHQRYPFDVLAGEIKEETGSDPGYLLNINLVGHGDLEEKKFKVQRHFAGYEPSHLAVHINTGNKNIHGVLELEWDYQVERFSAAGIEQIHRGLVNILTGALDQPGKNLSEIDLLSREEKEQILCEFNNSDPAIEYPVQAFCEQFERQVTAAPDGISL